jgi:enoyl-[acyl-carrier protein] reductase III
MVVPTTLDLTGKVALVTGGTRGLGRAIAAKLSASGAFVHLNYRHDRAGAQDAVTAMTGLPGPVRAVQADITVPEELAGLLDLVQAEHGRLDVLVHNAAAFRPMMAISADLAQVHAAIRLALDPLLLAASPVAKLMPQGGRIVAISSNGGSGVVPNYVAPGLAKAALENLVRYLAVELGPVGITVNAVATALIDKGRDTANPQIAGLLAARTPNGHLTRPEDVADAVALLCTPEAGWLQGQVLTADGGLGLHA